MSDRLDIEELCKSYYLDIYHFSLYFSNNKQDAEDITQETFLKAIHNFRLLKDSERAKYWLLSIARHTAIDHMRKKKIKSVLPGLIEKFAKNEQDDSTIDQILIKEKWEEVQRSLLKLKPHYRSLLILRGIQELSVKESAEVLGCTELKVRVDFHRAVKMLKREVILSEGVERNEKSRKSISRS
ncbi:RNA polymerase sigma factor [Ornithinibacillus californiensis]|jgi:RNA polymerase sigma-70 factor, ECF subfamily|uniref:RNA polymerase sigma factor n=1 Tax=Ornithinibacillus californiensis TaxID=161536 RepID=UPI00064E04C0|nr:RNA polymerase sigma factor [Ornithinibacillus californiensis]